MMERTLSTFDVMAVAGASYRQLDYWCRTGAIGCDQPARGQGSHRRFTPRQAACTWVVARLAEMGAQRDTLRRAFDALHDDGALWAGPVVVEAGRGGRVVPVDSAEGPGWVVDPRYGLAALAEFEQGNRRSVA